MQFDANGINNIIRSLIGRGRHLANSKLEERRVKSLNIINLIMIPWLVSAGAMRMDAGEPSLAGLDWLLALLYLYAYYRHASMLKYPRIMLVLASQLAVAAHITIALINDMTPEPQLKISVVILSFLILILFDGALLYLFLVLNTAFFSGPYLFLKEVDTISLLHGAYLFIAPLFVIRLFFNDTCLEEKAPEHQHGKHRLGVIDQDVVFQRKFDHPSIEEVFLKKLTETVFKNIDNNEFTVTQLARELGMSRSQLYRKIYNLTGQSISQFIKAKRLKYAYKLLKNNTGTVSEVAYKTGFSSPNYFNKCFKEKYNISPGGVKAGSACDDPVLNHTI